MTPFLVNGELWRVVGVSPDDPRLVDREGKRTIGTTDSTTRTIHISAQLVPPLLDRVLLHEIAHAIAVSYGRLNELGYMVRHGDIVGTEEWAAQMMENHSVEAVKLATEVLGRPVCVRGFCDD